MNPMFLPVAGLKSARATLAFVSAPCVLSTRRLVLQNPTPLSHSVRRGTSVGGDFQVSSRFFDGGGALTLTFESVEDAGRWRGDDFVAVQPRPHIRWLWDSGTPQRTQACSQVRCRSRFPDTEPPVLPLRGLSEMEWCR